MLDAGGVSDDSLDAQALWPMQDMWMQLRHAATRGQLHLSTSEAFSDHDQMFAAGYLEGYMTARTDCCPSCIHAL